MDEGVKLHYSIFRLIVNAYFWSSVYFSDYAVRPEIVPRLQVQFISES